MAIKYIYTVAAVLSAFFAQAQTADTLQQPKELGEVVVSSSKTSEALRLSPVSIQVLDLRQIKLLPAPSFFDALEGVQGVQVILPSLGFKVINARGFANTTNVRFAQLVDGMDVASPHIGGAIGNSLGPSDLDIQKVEVVPGVASTLYGMNTVNGLVNFITKNPFTSEGFSFQQQTGVNHLSDENSGAKMFSETSFRIDKVISQKIAFKINGAFTKGYDWIANNTTDLNPNGNISTGLTGTNNPAYDAVNIYGNESSDRKTIALAGKSYQVSRTGYSEKDLVNYNIQNIKGDVGWYYKLKPNATLSYTGRFALLDNVYQRANRFRLENYLLQQHGINYASPSINAKVYYNVENTGDSYNLRSMGENIDRNYKNDNAWYADYTTQYNKLLSTGSTVAQSHMDARGFADAGRYQPETDVFNNKLSQLQQINNWDSGAALKVKAAFLHAEAQVNLTEKYLDHFNEKTGINILAGADYRLYIIAPDGNYFVNPLAGQTGQDIHYGKVGGYVSVTKKIINNKLKLGAILRADKNDYFPLSWNPRFTAVFAPNLKNSIRASLQKGYRYPSIFEAYSNVNSGGVKRVGGLPVMSSGIFENAWLATSISSFQQAVLVDINTGGLTKNSAIVKEQGLLKKNPYTYLKPEEANTFEIGYRGFFIGGRLNINVDGYYSSFKNFIAQANMNVPKITVADSIPFALYDKTQQAQYRMYTNSQTKVYNYGFSGGATYTFLKAYTIGANTTFAQLHKAENEDGIEDGFDTPEWMVNTSLTKHNIIKNVDAGLTWKWQSGFYWQSFLANGNVASYNNFDAQASYTFQDIHVRVKAGANNLLNRYYYSFLGGPAIGGFYYVTLTYGLL